MTNLKNLFKTYNSISIGVKASVVYTVATLMSKGLNLITTPIFTRIMTTEQIGQVTTFTSWFTILSVLANLALNSGSFNVAMMEFENRRDEYESSILTLSTISSLCLFIIYFLLEEYVVKILELPSSLVELMLICFIVFPATDYWLARQRYEYKYKSVVFISVSSAFISSIFSILVVIVARNKHYDNLAELRLFSSNFILILVSCVMYINIMKKGKVYISREYWMFALKVSLPLILHTLSRHVLDVSDRIMIANILGKNDVGIYAILYSISSLSLIVWNAINNSLIPYMFEKLRLGNDSEKQINKIIFPLLMIYSIVCILLALIAPEIVNLLATKAYYKGIFIMPPVVAGIYLTSLYNIFGNVLLFHKKTNYIMISTLIAALVNVGLNYIFIKKIGIIGASYATLVSYVILTILQFIGMIKVHKKSIFNVKKLIIISCITLTGCLLCNFLYSYILIRYLLMAGIIIFLLFQKFRILKAIQSLK